MTGNPKNRTEEKEFEVLLKQYDTVRAEINLETTAQNNIINYSIALIAATFVIVGFKIDDKTLFIEKYPIILLFISIFQVLITWTALEAEYAIHELRSFIHNTLSEQIKANIKSTLKSDYFKMEIALNSKKNKPRTIIRGFLVSAKFLIPFAHGIIMFVIFCYSFNSFKELSILSITMFIITILLIMFVIFASLIHIKFVTKYYNKK